MIYVTFMNNNSNKDDINVLQFNDYENALEFCNENNLKPEECITITEW